MHILTLTERAEIPPADPIEPGEYVVEDVSGAQLLARAGGGTMRPMPEGQDAVRIAIVPAKNERMFVQRIGGFGDLVLLTPVLRTIKQRNPQGSIWVCCMTHYGRVLEGLPFIDRVVGYPCKYDEVKDCDTRIFLENAIERNPRAKELHMTELFAELAGLGEITDLKPEYRVKASEAVWAEAKYPRVNGTRRVCVAPLASALCRVYPGPLVSQTINLLLAKGWEVFMLGERGVLEIPKNAPVGIRNLAADGLTFRQSAAVVNGADALIGCDSALVHVAGALGVPAVGLYGPFPWELRTKYSPSVFGINGTGACAPCFHHPNASRRESTAFPPQCPSAAMGYCEVLARIKPERIVAKVEQLARAFGAQSEKVVPFP